MDVLIKIQYSKEIFKAAARFGLAAFFCVTANADLNLVMTKAKNLSLQRDRVQATKVLRDYIKSGKANSEEVKKAKKMLEKLSEIFYSAKALQVYELGKSQELSSVDDALKTFEEVHSLELGNVLPKLSIARITLLQGECDSSLKWSEEGLEVNPYKKDLIYLKAFSLGCIGDHEKLLSFLAKSQHIKMDDYFRISLGQAFLVDGDHENAKLWLAKVENRKIPEQFYFLGVMYRSESTEDYLKYFAKYVDLCGRKTQGKSSEMGVDPRRCKERAALEKKYKLLSGESVEKDVK